MIPSAGYTDFFTGQEELAWQVCQFEDFTFMVASKLE